MHRYRSQWGLPAVFATALAPAAAQAHVKWFVAQDEIQRVSAPFSFADPAVQLWSVLALMMLAASVWLDRRLPQPPQPQGLARILLERSLPVLTGLALLLAAESGSVVAPHYRWDGTGAMMLLSLEVAAGLLLLFPRTIYAGALMLVPLYAGVALRFGPVEVLEYFNVVGTAAFLYCVFHPSPARRAQLAPFALPLLRICTGIALIALGFSEKLLRPEYAEEFLQTYMWNFMQRLGFENYTDHLFVLSAGTMEVVFGAILVLGTTTRLNIVAISGFMLTSNLTFFVEGHTREAVTEIIGHLPIMATALVCVFCGGGDRLRIGALLRPRIPVYSSA